LLVRLLAICCASYLQQQIDSLFGTWGKFFSSQTPICKAAEILCRLLYGGRWQTVDS
jgi:hypothetical protein